PLATLFARLDYTAELRRREARVRQQQTRLNSWRGPTVRPAECTPSPSRRADRRGRQDMAGKPARRPRFTRTGWTVGRLWRGGRESHVCQRQVQNGLAVTRRAHASVTCDVTPN